MSSLVATVMMCFNWTLTVWRKRLHEAVILVSQSADKWKERKIIRVCTAVWGISVLFTGRVALVSTWHPPLQSQIHKEMFLSACWGIFFRLCRSSWPQPHQTPLGWTKFWRWATTYHLFAALVAPKRENPCRHRVLSWLYYSVPDVGSLTYNGGYTRSRSSLDGVLSSMCTCLTFAFIGVSVLRLFMRLHPVHLSPFFLWLYSDCHMFPVWPCWFWYRSIAEWSSL